MRRRKLHFLHIGKTGGSAIKSALREHPKTPGYSLKLHGHGTTLADIPVGQSLVFFLRDPLSRFVSGFYSRQRKGLPRRYSEWRGREKEVFETFATPGELACALADPGGQHHALAIAAMDEVTHLKKYGYWYGDMEYFQTRISDIVFVGFQETLDADFSELKQILQLPPSLSLPGDDVSAHKSPEGLDKSIGEAGLIALKEWYADDIKFVSLCREIVASKASSS